MNKSEKPALVGIVPRRDLWPIIQAKRWYHIPVEAAPRNVSEVEYISFYFPAAFGEKLRYQVIYYAAVLNIDTVKRFDLFPDEPKHPIPTSLQKLFTAQEINDGNYRFREP